MTDHPTIGSRRPGRAAARPWAALLPMAAILAGCVLQGERPLALAGPDAPTRPAVAAPAGVGTARSAERSRADDGPDPVAGAQVAAIPSPRQIFDFHPAGASADAWREPFVIDPNDGPLAADVRRTAAELKAFMAASKADPQGGLKSAGGRRCGETDVATAKPGCPAPARPAPAP